METDVLNKFDDIKNEDVMEIQSSGPLEIKTDDNEDDNSINNLLTVIEENDNKKGKKRKMDDSHKEKEDPVMQLEGKS